jgi:rhamnosyltransferase
MILNPPQASAIVRTFNSAATLPACLESLKMQTIRPQIVVVDSGSSDATVAVAAEQADRIVRLPQESFSYGRALNCGAKAADAPVHFAVSSHCVIPRRDWIARSLTYYENPEVAATSGQLTDPCGAPLREALHLTAHTRAPDPLWGFSNHASSWRADVWRREPFDETLIASEDFEWADRVLRLGYTIVFDPELTVIGRHRTAQGLVALHRRSRRELLGTAACRSVQPPMLGASLQEWWQDHPPATKRWRQLLSPYRLAVISGRYMAGRTLRRHGQDEPGVGRLPPDRSDMPSTELRQT